MTLNTYSNLHESCVFLESGRRFSINFINVKGKDYKPKDQYWGEGMGGCKS